MKLHDTYSKQEVAREHACALHGGASQLQCKSRRQQHCKGKVASAQNEQRRLSPFGGRLHFLLKGCAKLPKRSAPEEARSFSKDNNQRRMRRHAAMWNRLDARAKDTNEQRARMAGKVEDKNDEDDLRTAHPRLAPASGGETGAFKEDSVVAASLQPRRPRRVE